MTPEQITQAADEGRRQGRSSATGLPLPAIDLIEGFEQIKATSAGWFDFSVEKGTANSARVTSIFNEASGAPSRFGIDVDSTGCVNMGDKSVEEIFLEGKKGIVTEPTADESVALVIRRTAEAVAQRLYLAPQNGKMQEIGYSDARDQAQKNAAFRPRHAPGPQ
jgi:hypothetical protein